MDAQCSEGRSGRPTVLGFMAFALGIDPLLCALAFSALSALKNRSRGDSFLSWRVELLGRANAMEGLFSDEGEESDFSDSGSAARRERRLDCEEVLGTD